MINTIFHTSLPLLKNKLDRSPWQVVLGKARSLPTHCGSSLWWVLPRNVGLGWKNVPKENTLAYLPWSSVRKEKRFITLVPRFLQDWSSLGLSRWPCQRPWSREEPQWPKCRNIQRYINISLKTTVAILALKCHHIRQIPWKTKRTDRQTKRQKFI